ncbi:conserved hypothetical protein [Lebetimonas natsushimae]|uniref:DUF3373 domain-containing protein n=1 Tax=Lebetimonas natsushimae TaxID=1936991 RepID=A0A292YCU9_9BACT|nr:DUF3373 family protein [Lebetimonas natsushimae]GAX87145.1 conserved hypothetical protein [Lebetimonas natsushimae]
MKKILLSASVVAGLFAQPTVEQLQKQIELLQQQLNQLKASQQKVEKKVEEQNSRYYKKVSPVVANSHLFWGFDLRTAFDYINKETTKGYIYGVDPMTMKVNVTGKPADEKHHIGQVLQNRVILTGVYKPADNLKATVRVEANKVFGGNSINGMNQPFQNYDWIANETPDDAYIRIKEAFFNYYFGPDNGLMFSAGRRPATQGFPANLVDEDSANSPLGHLINMEFDGFSFEIGNPLFAKLSDKFADWGTWMKFCLGRGYTDTTGKWSMSNENPDYTKTGTRHADFGGFLLIPYDDGQYSLKTETVWAFNLQGFEMQVPNYEMAKNQFNQALAYNMDLTGTSVPAKMDTLGNYFGENVVFAAQGIGDGISDFLDNTTAFASWALSQTRPKSGKRMLGSTQKKTGHSFWIGADMPGFGDNDRFGVSYVYGSKYWRSFTYGEDTLAGSIAAVRGHAYDVYYNHEIIPHLTAQLRYTYIDYAHPGSDAFFGDMGDPDLTAFSYVKKAQDIRAYIRYNF